MGPLLAVLPVVSAVAGVAGAAVAGVGAIEAGNAASANASYQAQVARNNAQIANENAQFATESGETQQAAQGAKAKASVGAVVAAEGANGVDVNTGSAANVVAGAKSLANLDSQTIMSNASRQAFGYQVAASSDTSQAALDTAEASQAQTAGTVGALGSFLSGISSVGANYTKYQSLGTGASAAGVQPNVGVTGQIY